MKADFKPIHFYNHESGESFQIICRESLINFINDCDPFHNAFDNYEELKAQCLQEYRT